MAKETGEFISSNRLRVLRGRPGRWLSGVAVAATALTLLLRVVAGGGAHAATRQVGDLAGAWNVDASYPAFGIDFHGAITYAPEGTVAESFMPQVDGDAEGRPFVFISAAQGVWQHTGDGQFAYTVVWYDYDEHGIAVGTETAAGSLTIGKNGDGFSGPFTDTVTDPNGKQLGAYSGVLSGQRMKITAH